MENVKICSHCNRALPFSEFNKHGRAKDGLQVYCKTCHSQRTVSARSRNTPPAK